MVVTAQIGLSRTIVPNLCSFDMFLLVLRRGYCAEIMEAVHSRHMNLTCAFSDDDGYNVVD